MNIEIPNDCKVAHLLFSGGVDSTLLLYLLAKEQQNKKNFVIKCYGMNINKYDVHYVRCKNIIKEIELKFNTNIYFKTFNQLFWIKTIVNRILELEPGLVFSGCNKVLDFLQPSNYIPYDTPPVRGEAFSEFHARPFIDLDKSEIIQCYIQENIVSLLNMTYSCGYQKETECGNCYFCLEKDWALKQCNLTI